MFVLFLFVILFISVSSSGLDKIVIDTDAGGDDAIALLLVLQAEKNSDFRTIAVTCTYGNTKLENVESNVLKTLTIAHRSDIPVFGGADRALTQVYQPSNYFGNDGFGDFDFGRPILGSIDRSRHAALALIDLSKQHPGEITLLAIGPLTNIALAQRLDPGFISRLQNLVVLGGSVKGVGNKAPNVEFNFFQDPEGNLITLNASLTENPLTLVPWESVLEANISKEWRTTVFHNVHSSITEFLDKAERVSLDKSTIWKPSDAVAAAIMIWPDLIKKSTLKNVTPVTDGGARGSVLVDYAETTGKSKNAKILQEIDDEKFLKLLLTHFS